MLNEQFVKLLDDINRIIKPKEDTKDTPKKRFGVNDICPTFKNQIYLHSLLLCTAATIFTSPGNDLEVRLWFARLSFPSLSLSFFFLNSPRLLSIVLRVSTLLVQTADRFTAHPTPNRFVCVCVSPKKKRGKTLLLSDSATNCPRYK